MSFSWVSPELHIDAPPAVPYFCFPVWISTLLTGKFICNCLYLNWLGNKSLAKKSFRKVVLADSCRGLSLAMRSISVTYCKSVPNRACQEGRKSWLSFIVFRKFICANPCIIAPMVRSRPLAPDGNQPILTKWCKYLPDFTSFCFNLPNLYLPKKGWLTKRVNHYDTTHRISKEILSTGDRDLSKDRF